MAIATERQYLGDAIERYHTHIADGESKAPVIEILGREAVTDMGISIGKMVRRLGAITDVKRAELAAEGEKEAPREIDSEPEVEWEEGLNENTIRALDYEIRALLAAAKMPLYVLLPNLVQHRAPASVGPDDTSNHTSDSFQ